MAPTNKRQSKTEVVETKAKIKSEESDKKLDSQDETDDIYVASEV